MDNTTKQILGVVIGFVGLCVTAGGHGSVRGVGIIILLVGIGMFYNAEMAEKDEKDRKYLIFPIRA